MQQSIVGFHEFISKASLLQSSILLHNETDINPIPREEVEISKYKYSLGESIRTISNFSFLLDDACIIKTQLTPCYLHRGEKDEAKYDILSHTYWQEEQRKRKYRKRNRTE